MTAGTLQPFPKPPAPHGARLRDATWPDRRGRAYLLAFCVAASAHAALLFCLKDRVVQGADFAVISGDTSLEVSLVAAGPVPETSADPLPEAEEEFPPEPETEPPPAEPTPEPPVELPPEPEPAPPPPPDAMVEPMPDIPKPAPAPRKAQAPKPRSATPPKPSTRRTSVANALSGDGRPAAPGTGAAGGRGGVAGDRAKPGYLRNPHPAYPAEARRAQQQGVVQIRVRVTADGRVAAASLARSSGFPMLDERALSTVRDRWTFKPARAAGIAIASDVVVPIRFSIRN